MEPREEKIINSFVPKREEVLKRRICLFVHRCLFKINSNLAKLHGPKKKGLFSKVPCPIKISQFGSK